MNSYKNTQAESLVLRSYDEMLARWDVEVEEVDLETSHGLTHCLLTGDPNGPPLVLFHGVGDNSAVMWVLNIGGLSQHFRCIAVDTLGGPGKSRPNAAFGSDFVQINWQLEVLDSLGLTDTNLAGVSNGGYMAYNLCVKAPDRVRKAVCIEGGMVTSPLKAMLTVLRMMMPEMLIPTEKNLRKVMAKLLSPESDLPRKHPYIVDHVLLLMKAHNRRAMYAHKVDPYNEEEGIRYREKLLFLMGDHQIKTKTEFLAQLEHGGYSYDVIAGAGHGLNQEQPEVVNQRIVRFLQER
jgi:pimeloyl-ACP methyl ester carboxylesterase